MPVFKVNTRRAAIEPLFAGQPDDMLQQWASLFDSPLWNTFLLDKTGYNGMLWGAIWTCCLWLIVRYCNMRNIYWKI